MSEAIVAHGERFAALQAGSRSFRNGSNDCP